MILKAERAAHLSWSAVVRLRFTDTYILYSLLRGVGWVAEVSAVEDDGSSEFRGYGIEDGVSEFLPVREDNQRVGVIQYLVTVPAES